MAAVQLCGADIVPTRVARPTPADTADPPKFGDPIEPIAGPTWLSPTVLIADGAVAAENKAGLKPALEPATAKNPISPNAPVVVSITEDGFTQLPERNPFASPELMKEPKADPVEPLRVFNNPAIPVVAWFEPGAKGLTAADDNGDESPCSELGTLEITCDSVDCTPLVVAVPVAWATAPAWSAVPAGLAVSGGAFNGGTVAAAAEAPA